MSLHNIPDELKALPNWTGWNGENRKPLNLRTGGNAQSDNSATWSSFDIALKKCDELTGDFEGAGIVVPSGFVGFDFDGVVKDGVVEPFVQVILRLLGNPYCELSPSETGLRAFVRYAGPALPKTVVAKDDSKGKYAIEIFSGSHTPKVLTVTGNHVSGQGIPALDSLQHAYALCSRLTNEPFKKLWLGDSSAHGNDDSRADFALLCMLADLTHANAEQMEMYFNASVRGQREKWTSREDYRATSIAAALKAWAKKPDYTKTGEKRQKKAGAYTPLVFKYPKVEGGAFDFVVAPPVGFDDGWFPRGDPHVIGGPSGSNKTTVILDMLRTQLAGEDFLGHRTYGLPYLVITGDRGRKAHLRTLHRMRLEEGAIPTVFLPSVWGDDAIHAILDAIEAREVMPAIVFVEGCDMLVEDAAKMHIVAPFIDGLRQIAEHYHISIIGSVGSPKQRMGEGYASKRDNLFGTVVWSRKTETVAVIQYVGGDDTDCHRQLAVLLRNGPAEKFNLKMEHGRMVVVADGESVPEPSKQRADIEWFRKQTGWFTAHDVERELKTSTASAHRWVEAAYANHTLRTKQKLSGAARQYRWNEKSNNPENPPSDGGESGREDAQTTQSFS